MHRWQWLLSTLKKLPRIWQYVFVIGACEFSDADAQRCTDKPSWWLATDCYVTRMQWWRWNNCRIQGGLGDQGLSWYFSRCSRCCSGNVLAASEIVRLQNADGRIRHQGLSCCLLLPKARSCACSLGGDMASAMEVTMNSKYRVPKRFKILKKGPTRTKHLHEHTQWYVCHVNGPKDRCNGHWHGQVPRGAQGPDWYGLIKSRYGISAAHSGQSNYIGGTR